MRYQDKAYVIYTKPYRETSAIIKVFSSQSGILSGVVKGVHSKSRQSASLRSALQVGNLIECQWQSKSSLKNIFQIELVEHTSVVSPQKFLCLAYVNELLLYVLPEEQISENLFHHYGDLLKKINLEIPVELLLRLFELTLLEEMGFAFDFAWDVVSDEPVHKDKFYVIVPGTGIRLAVESDYLKVSGKDLLLLAEKDFSQVSTLVTAKKVNRLLLDYHLEGRVLKTRKLYQEWFIDNRQVD